MDRLQLKSVSKKHVLHGLHFSFSQVELNFSVYNLPETFSLIYQVNRLLCVKKTTRSFPGELNNTLAITISVYGTEANDESARLILVL